MLQYHLFVLTDLVGHVGRDGDYLVSERAHFIRFESWEFRKGPLVAHLFSEMGSIALVTETERLEFEFLEPALLKAKELGIQELRITTCKSAEIDRLLLNPLTTRVNITRFMQVFKDADDMSDELKVIEGNFELNQSSFYSAAMTDTEQALRSFQIYTRVPEEERYLKLCRRVLKTGQMREDRTGVGTIGLFGQHLDFNLEHSFPLLTTKKVFWRGVVEELLWFLRGSVNTKELTEKKVTIWDGNSSRQFLDARGLKNYTEGEIGPGYGWQWRNFGAAYNFNLPREERGGVDQVQGVIDMIRKNPMDRRLLVSAWNPAQLDAMALPPCHMLYQFYVTLSPDGKPYGLCCQMYQRSADLFLGVPMNIASYALLTYMVAHLTGLVPISLSLTFGDAHIYRNHIEAVQTQLTRLPSTPPTLKILRLVASIDDFRIEDFELVNYQPAPAIKASMAV
jgi:thymidylate synthase